MDLFAYAKIEDLGQLAKKNGIEIPRLRGYRLMKDEEPLPQSQIDKMKKECVIEIAERLCRAEPFWDPHADCSRYCDYTDHLIRRYLVEGKDADGRRCNVGIRWDRIHGKKRKILKYEIKKTQREIQAQWDMWNKYAGKENVLYIHSRMGGPNWAAYEEQDKILSQPWFLDRVDDWWDYTYCDFYAKLN